MQKYKYETHTHTSEGSKCSRITAAELVRFYKASGYSGVCITDHFFNGNTTVARELSWAERIELLCRGYDNAYGEGNKIGIEVFLGWEYSYETTDLLTYGLNKEWLLKHPEIISIGINEYCDLVHEHGGFIVHAHPFREAEYIDMIRLLPRKVDAIEIYNACCKNFENKVAVQYADNYKLLKSAGSDNHIGNLYRLFGLQSVELFKSIEDMIGAIKSGKTDVFACQ